ncbi:MAG: DNA alkylation repair protein [bacterium]
MPLVKFKQDLSKLKNQTKADAYAWFFKTGKGEYGEGDFFLGLTVPEMRMIAKKYINLSLQDVEKLLTSIWHEHRLTGALILTYKYDRADSKEQKQIFDFYLKHTKGINNWDLVDLTAHKIVGAYLHDNPRVDRKILYKLVKSSSLWERRIAIIATFNFIKQHDYHDALRIAELLLKDEQDLIHKAVGWMLREIGKRDQKTEEAFLQKHYQTMPRTMLRYSLEKFSDAKRKKYMKK